MRLFKNKPVMTTEEICTVACSGYVLCLLDSGQIHDMDEAEAYCGKLVKELLTGEKSSAVPASFIEIAVEPVFALAISTRWRDLMKSWKTLTADNTEN